MSAVTGVWWLYVIPVCCTGDGRRSALPSGLQEPHTVEGHHERSTHVSSDSIAVSLINAMAKRRLYDTPQWDAKLTWFTARLMPETFRNIILYLYRHRLWVFNDR